MSCLFVLVIMIYGIFHNSRKLASYLMFLGIDGVHIFCYHYVLYLYSAGVGRSGTFICLDRILQQILVADYVDIFGIVYAMRKERVWMVQTEQQYICIHQCLLTVLEGKEITGPPREIHDNQGFEGQ